MRHLRTIEQKNNSPRYLLMEFDAAEQEQLASSESLDEISKRLIAKNEDARDSEKSMSANADQNRAPSLAELDLKMHPYQRTREFLYPFGHP